MKKNLCLSLTVLFSMVCLYTATASADYMALVNKLTQSTGVSDQQAMGGAGSIFKTAKANMSTENFSKIADAIPGMDKLLGAAPETSALSSSLGSSAGSVMGKRSTSMSSMGLLAESFSKLGMDAEMVKTFMPIVLDFVQTQGGPLLESLLKKALL